MNFDIVIANPPYDRTDIQMKFGLACFDICNKYNVMIIPAKWQCKGDKTKEKLYSTFRKEVVPHMSKICFYLDSTEIFNISEYSGITYYIADRHKEFNIKTIENRCEANKYYNDTREREFTVEGIGKIKDEPIFDWRCKQSLNNKGQQVLNRLGTFKPYIVSEHKNPYRKYQYWCNELISAPCKTAEDGKFINCIMSPNTGMLQVLSSGELNTSKDIMNGLQHTHYNPLFVSESMLELKNYLSYIHTKFIRFLIFNSICGLSSTGQDTWWRFVPDPGKFDHIFTDKELYKQYKLTPDEIAIIEGTIAERPFSTVWGWIPKEYQELAQ